MAIEFMRCSTSLVIKNYNQVAPRQAPEENGGRVTVKKKLGVTGTGQQGCGRKQGSWGDALQRAI